MVEKNWKYSEHREYFQNKMREWSRKNADKVHSYYTKLKMQMFTHYSGKCACCGESHFEFLTIDHINGGGEEHRRKIAKFIGVESRKCSGVKFYQWLIKNNFPEGFQVLCSNCNMAKGRNKAQFCPVHHPELYELPQPL